MAKAQYVARTSSAVALSAATARTALMVIAPSTFGIDWKKYRISFDGVTASAVPVTVEKVSCDLTSNVTPGTNNTSETVRQVLGRTVTPGFTAFSASTTEPTVLTVLDAFTLTPTSGTLFYDFPLGDTWDVGVSTAFGIRLTAPASVNARVSMYVERC